MYNNLTLACRADVLLVWANITISWPFIQLAMFDLELGGKAKSSFSNPTPLLIFDW